MLPMVSGHPNRVDGDWESAEVDGDWATPEADVDWATFEADGDWAPPEVDGDWATFQSLRPMGTGQPQSGRWGLGTP